MERGKEKTRAHGRGSPFNLKNRFESRDLTFEDGVAANEVASQRTQILPEDSKSILSYNQSPDVPFEVGINPYRGCEHGCSYCFARPTHEYLGFSSGLDFESKIVAKTNAAQLLEKELGKKSWKPQTIALSGNTDCYQPIERKYKLTRSCLQTLSMYRNPAAIITKNFLVTRDLDILESMAKWNGCMVFISMTTLDENLRKKMEPRTSTVNLRLKAIEMLSARGVTVGVLIAPLIPGLNDSEMPGILKSAREKGASHASYILLRLPYQVKEIFSQWLHSNFPEHAKKVLHRIQDMRGGKLYESDFATRMRGKGVWADQFEKMFRLYQLKYGLGDENVPLNCDEFINAGKSQLSLF